MTHLNIFPSHPRTYSQDKYVLQIFKKENRIN